MSKLYHSVLALASLFLTSPIWAQSVPGVPLIIPQVPTAQINELNNFAVQDALGEADVVNPRAAESADFSYRYSAARTQQNLRRFIERTPENAGCADLQNMISAQPNIIEEVGGAMRRYGLDPHNVADAYAMWWVNSWSASQKTNREPNRKTIAAVKQQTRNAFAATPDFAKAGDADRQEYAEALMLQALLISAAFEQNKNNPAMLDQLAEVAKKGAKESGIDLSLMTLTENGFVPRTGADASKAVPDDEADARLALATEQADEGETDDMPTYLKYGAVALAGLGLAFVAGKSMASKG